MDNETYSHYVYVICFFYVISFKILQAIDIIAVITLRFKAIS